MNYFKYCKLQKKKTQDRYHKTKHRDCKKTLKKGENTETIYLILHVYSQEFSLGSSPQNAVVVFHVRAMYCLLVFVYEKDKESRRVVIAENVNSEKTVLSR